MKTSKLEYIFDTISFLILLLSIIMILSTGAKCPENINTFSVYGLIVSTVCKFGFTGIIWTILALISFVAVIFLTNKIIKKQSNSH